MSTTRTGLYRESASQHEQEALVLENLPLVRHVLGKIVGRLPSNVDVDNLESAGVLGLVEASHHFDESRGAFVKYAYPRIWGAIIDELRRNSPLPQKVHSQIAKIRKAEEQMEPPVTAERIAESTGLSIAEIESCWSAMRLVRTSPIGEFALATFDEVGTKLEMEEARQALATCIEALPEQQRMVVTMYYSEDMRLKEIGQVMGLSESRISRILSKAEFKIRHFSRSTANE